MATTRDLPEALVTSITAGSVAAIFQTTVTYPFEFLKTGMQLQRAIGGASHFNMLHQLKFYFAGCSAVNVGTVLKTAARFTTFEKACDLMRDAEDQKGAPLTGPRLLLAGAVTGFMESLLVIPFESIKTTMIENALVMSKRAQPGDKAAADANEPKPKVRATFHKPDYSAVSPRQKLFLHYKEHPSSHFFGTIREIYLTRGLRGFVQGTAPTIIRQMANSSVRFTSYTMMKQFVSPNKPLNEYYAFALGALSSCAVVAVTQPIDVIKTRMQSKYAWSTYKSSVNCAYRIFVEEGISQFWRGWAPRLMKVSLAGSVSFGVYQYTENLLLYMKHAGRPFSN
ncbi:LAMI_0D02014g1_1 [Lachancea mirantina]|uniref:LAMI_0D02014g1_1 n=1 Tax=Lachancea mirantina TaxID=1230905 RepID=A0A1G4J9K7_9SACH|nr:LAMI_0D02014g1_1 [Lachancea mirantina]